MTQLEDFYKDWIQCENYDVLNKLRVCKVLDQVYGISDRLGILVFMEQWLPHLFVLFFIVSISFMLFASLTEEQMCLKEIRSRVGSNWYDLLTLIYAVRLSQELSKRNECLKIEAMKYHVISNSDKSKPIQLKMEPTEIPPNIESQNSSHISLSPKISTISQISPRTKKPKLDNDSGIESMSQTDNESRKLLHSLNSMDLLEALRRNSNTEYSKDSDTLVAPPSSPVTSPSTPRNKESSTDMNISSSIKCGIFEKRKNFFEKTKFEKSSPRRTRSDSLSSDNSSSERICKFKMVGDY